eukprot:393950-Prorocentrum_lima.AAC.1
MQTRRQKSANNSVMLTTRPSDVGATSPDDALADNALPTDAGQASEECHLSFVRHAARTTTSNLASENQMLPT